MMLVCRTLQGGMLQHGMDHCQMLRVKLLQVSEALGEVERPVEDELTRRWSLRAVLDYCS